MEVTAVVSIVLFNIHCSLSQGIYDDNAVLYDEAGSGRQIQLQNVSLVITYTGMVVAALMMAGFLYLALNFSGRRSGYGYGGYGHSYAEDDYFDGYYSKRETHKGGAGFMSHFFRHINKFERRQDDEE